MEPDISDKTYQIIEKIMQVGPKINLSNHLKEEQEL